MFYRYNGLVHKKVVGVDMEEGKVTLTTKNTKGKSLIATKCFNKYV